MPGDQIADQALEWRAGRIERQKGRIHRVIGTLIRLLVGDKVTGNQQAVLEVVDAERGGFVERDGAEMAGDLEPPGMGRLDGCSQFLAGDVGVGLERGDPETGPVLDGAAGVVGSLQRVHLIEQGESRALEVRSGHIHLGPGHPARVDGGLDLEVGIRLETPTRAHRGCTSGEIQPRKAEALLVGEITAGPEHTGIEHVLVHHDEPGKHGPPRQIDHLGARWDADLRRIPQRSDETALQDDDLVRPGLGSSAVDHPRMDQGHDRGVDFDEGPRVGRKRGSLARCTGDDPNAEQGEGEAAAGGHVEADVTASSPACQNPH